MSVVIRLLEVNGGQPTAMDGQWLVEYDPARFGVDPDGNPMIAHIKTSPEKADALVFETVADAHALWTSVDPENPIRPDGEPNRPLTAFSIEMVKP